MLSNYEKNTNIRIANTSIRNSYIRKHSYFGTVNKH